MAQSTHHGNIIRIEESGLLLTGQTLSIIADGYNTTIESPHDQRFRWIPEEWRLSDGVKGSFSNNTPFRTNIPLTKSGELQLFITYTEEIFDGYHWQETGYSREVEEAVVKIE